MTNQELNRDIKRLLKSILKASNNIKDNDNTKYFSYIENEAKTEYLRLFYADKGFTALTRTSILIMLRLNVKHRFVQFHDFGLMIDLEKL